MELYHTLILLFKFTDSRELIFQYRNSIVQYFQAYEPTAMAECMADRRDAILV